MIQRRLTQFTLFIFVCCYCTNLWALSWIVFYGSESHAPKLPAVDLAILESDHWDATLLINGKTQYYGYLSLGEAESNRPYFKRIQNKDFVLHKNPNWPQSHYVDIRSKDWQNIVLNQLIPQILKKGYQGIFLDTIDTAIYLEDTQPEKYKGSKKEMVDFIKKIRKTYPSLKIIPNNGLELLSEWGGIIDGVLVEDLHTQYNFKTNRYQKTNSKVTEQKLTHLKDFLSKHKKPVLNLIYAKQPDDKLAQYGIEESKRLGLEWYVTTLSLTKLGRVDR